MRLSEFKVGLHVKSKDSYRIYGKLAKGADFDWSHREFLNGGRAEDKIIAVIDKGNYGRGDTHSVYLYNIEVLPLQRELFDDPTTR